MNTDERLLFQARVASALTADSIRHAVQTILDDGPAYRRVYFREIADAAGLPPLPESATEDERAEYGPNGRGKMTTMTKLELRVRSLLQARGRALVTIAPLEVYELLTPAQSADHYAALTTKRTQTVLERGALQVGQAIPYITDDTDRQRAVENETNIRGFLNIVRGPKFSRRNP